MKSVYGYDSSGRTTALTHRNASNAIIIGYTASYDSAGRLGGVTENNGSATSYGYDFAGRLLSENRTGTNPYASTYSYTNRGQRATAFRSENGVASHNGTYTYDDAGRLTNVADTVTASGLGGSYTWNNDSTLASYPGPGYTRLLGYDEERNPILFSRQTANGPQPSRTLKYAFDGALRNRADVLAGTEEWYPCGAACEAGDLASLEKASPTSWVPKASKLDSFVNGSLMLHSLNGDVARIVPNSGTVIALAPIDVEGVKRGPGAVAEDICVELLEGNDEGLQPTMAALGADFEASFEPSALVVTAAAAFTCGKKPKPIPWFVICKETAKAIARSEYCRNCYGLCQLDCDERDLQGEPGFNYDKCIADCKARNKKCKKMKKFPPNF
ncbi:MAG: hypothetical protein QE269_11025 [Fimbriimonas sp.]|nr:hypothetical protein [Fimbriimonas sp.]